MRDSVLIVFALLLLSNSQVLGQTSIVSSAAGEVVVQSAPVSATQTVAATSQPAIQGHIISSETSVPIASENVVYQEQQQYQQPVYYSSSRTNYQNSRPAVYYQPRPQRQVFSGNPYGNTPITQRPSRPGHPYGNLVRFVNRLGR